MSSPKFIGPPCKPTSCVEWVPSPVVALATLPNNSVAAARKDGTLEVWGFVPGSAEWRIQKTVKGDSLSPELSSLLWCPRWDRLISSTIDGTVYQWDLDSLTKITLLNSVGLGIHKMAVSPVSSGSLMDAILMACIDGEVRLYHAYGPGLQFIKAFPNVGCPITSVAWSYDGASIFAGCSNGSILGWKASCSSENFTQKYDIDEFGSKYSVLDMLCLSNGRIVVADLSGRVRFLAPSRGYVLDEFNVHKGQVNALAASQNLVFSAGSDGTVNLHYCTYEFYFNDYHEKRWLHVESRNMHPHELNALTLAYPIVRKNLATDADVADAVLISAGYGEKLFASSAAYLVKVDSADINPKVYPLADSQLTSSILDMVKRAADFKQLKKGIRKTTKILHEGTTEFVVMAADTGALEELLHLRLIAEDKKVPYVFVPSKYELRQACGTTRRFSALSLKRVVESPLHLEIQALKYDIDRLFI